MSPKAAHLEATASAVSVKMTTAAIHATRRCAQIDTFQKWVGRWRKPQTPTGYFFPIIKCSLLKN